MHKETSTTPKMEVSLLPTAHVLANQQNQINNAPNRNYNYYNDHHHDNNYNTIIL